MKKVEWVVKSKYFESAEFLTEEHALGVMADWIKDDMEDVVLIRRETETTVKEEVVG